MCANIHDIKESDELFVQMLQAMKDIDCAGVDENNFNEVILPCYPFVNLKDYGFSSDKVTSHCALKLVVCFVIEK